MKKTIILFASCFALLLLSCEKTRMDGDWDDIVKLSNKEVKFDKSGGTIRITTKGDFWWLSSDILINGEIVFLYGNSEINVELGKIKGWDNPNVIYDEGADMEIKKIESTWFSVTKDTYKSLIITLQPNETELPRFINLNIQAGNYFDYVKIEQAE